MQRGWTQTLFSGAHARTRGNRHKVENKRFDLNIKKYFSTARLIEYCPRLLREVVESPSLRYSKAI